MSFPLSKCLCAFILGAGALSAADYSTGQGARLVIGQRTFTAHDPALNGASNVLLGAAGGLAYAANTLFVADANRVGASPLNNRVLLYNQLSSQLPKLTDELPQTARCNVCVGTANVVLGQPDFATTTIGLSQTGLRTPTAVASDGQILAVADTDNNRVLIWRSIPTSNNAPADVVIGQADFTHSVTSVPPTAKSMRGPQGVWIQNGKLFVADTQDNRVLIYNQIPTANGAAADVVLGAPDFTTFVEVDLTKLNASAKADNMLNPVSVTSDGTRLFVTDLGFQRILIWNTIPAANAAPANVALGEPDLTSAAPNNAFTIDANGKQTPVLCPTSVGTDSNNNPIYPSLCAATVSFPRYALSDGTRLYVADGGNDRVLIYSQIPTQSGASADIILGQPDASAAVTSDGANFLITPMSLAWDGANLYVSDTYNLRVLVFTPAAPNVPVNAIRNAASREVFAVGAITLGGTITANDKVTATIGGKAYTYTIQANDTFATVLNGLVALINAGSGDPNVIALANPLVQRVELTARVADLAGNSVTLASSISDGATILAAVSSATLVGGQNSAQLAPGTIISIWGTNLADNTESAPVGLDHLPTEMGGVQVYVDGVRIPLYYVSAIQINAQLPFEVNDADGVSLYVRTTHSGGSVTVTNAVGIPIVPQNPGIFAQEGTDPRPAVMFHGSAYATGVISVDGAIVAGEVANVIVNSRVYSYTVQASDTLASVRDALIALLNHDPQLTAYAAGSFTRIRLQARLPGAIGNIVTFTANVNPGTNLILTPISVNQALCCANQGPVTAANPAIPGESVTIYAAGLGLLDISANGGVLAVPAAPTATSVGGSGTSVFYFIETCDALGNCTPPSPASASVSVASTLSSTSYAQVTWAPVPGANSYIVLRSNSSTVPSGSLAGGTALDSTGRVNSVSLTSCNATACSINDQSNALTVYQVPVVNLTNFLATDVATGTKFTGGLNTPVAFVASLAGGKTANILLANLAIGFIGVYQVDLQLAPDLTTNPLTQLTISQASFVSNVVTFPVVAP